MRKTLAGVALAIALMAVGVGAGPASAKNHTVTLKQLEQYAANQKACTAAIKSKKVVTVSARKACLDEAFKESLPCPHHEPALALIPDGNDTYLMTVGHRPEKIDEPTDRQLPYVCAHGTFKGAPSPYPSGV